MSTINCSENDCMYQKDGKCGFNRISSGFICTTKPCIHYVRHSPSDINRLNIQKPN